MNRSHPIQLVMLACLLAVIPACGGGGGGGGKGGSSTSVDLGSRLLPGFSIQVAQLPAVAGVITIRAVVTPDVGTAAPTKVEGVVSATQPADTAWVAGAADGVVMNAWTWSTLAAFPAGSHIWVRVTDVDDNQVSSGASDFALVP